MPIQHQGEREFASWLAEELDEYGHSTTIEGRLDAILDMMGLLLLEIGSVDPFLIAKAYDEYVKAQVVRDRPLFYHHTIIKGIIMMMLSSAVPTPEERTTQWKQVRDSKFGRCVSW